MHMKTLLIILVIVLQQGSFANSINVMTFNIRYDNPKDGDNGWKFRKEHVAEVITREQPDVIAIQEATKSQMEYLQSQFEHLAPIGEHTKGGQKGEFAGLFINKTKFDVLNSGQLWLSKTPLKKGSIDWDSALSRSATWAKIKSKGEKSRPFIVFGTHFDHRGVEARLESAKLLISKIEELGKDIPVILMGDLNCQLKSEPMKQFLESGLKVAVTENAGGTFHSFKGNTNGRRIDFILLNQHWIVESASILRPRKGDKSASDHDPVVATINIAKQNNSSTQGALSQIEHE